jgi:hypothetical protein
MTAQARVAIWIWLIALLLGAWVFSAVAAHAHATAAAEGIPDYVYTSGCCNKNDCFEVPNENVGLLIDGGYALTVPDMAPNAGQVLRVEKDKVRDSGDGKYWACFNNYRECDRTGKNCKPKPWTLRCFFRPVNA